MSNDPNTSTNIRAFVKEVIGCAFTLIFALVILANLSVQFIGDWSDSSLTDKSIIMIGVHVSLLIAGLNATSLPIVQVLSGFRVVAVVVAMSYAVTATIVSILHGAPEMTWPMQNVGHNQFVALGVNVYCVGILILLTRDWRNWLRTKISGRS